MLMSLFRSRCPGGLTGGVRFCHIHERKLRKTRQCGTHSTATAQDAETRVPRVSGSGRTSGWQGSGLQFLLLYWGLQAGWFQENAELGQARDSGVQLVSLWLAGMEGDVSGTMARKWMGGQDLTRAKMTGEVGI